MYLTPVQTIVMILAVAAGTQLTRWLPFWLFPEKKEPPAIVTYLGRVLSAATMGLLVVYCLKDVTWFSGDHGLPQIIAIVTVAILHRWKSNTLLSIAGGTAMYMFLVQVVFA
jgi:branched-subunit amino acid transport protein AzlD